jgi:S1-C subfamily serine protease
LIKIESPQTLQTAHLGTDNGPVMAGDRAVVMGFPRVAPAANTAAHPPGIVLADPTVHVGYVGRVMADRANASDELDRLCPRCYQLDAGNTGLSHSGGPVFNERGEVMGLFHMLVTREVTTSLSIPIRVGKALMGVQARK